MPDKNLLAVSHTPRFTPARPVQRQAPPPDPSFGQRLWNLAQRGVIDPDWMMRALTNGEYANVAEARNLQQSTDPNVGFWKRYGNGVLADTASTMSDFTSPLSLALLATGGLGKALPAGSKAARALGILGTTAGVGMTGKGMVDTGRAYYDMAENGVNPDNMQQAMSGTGWSMLGLGGLMDAHSRYVNPRGNTRPVPIESTLPEGHRVVTNQLADGSFEHLLHSPDGEVGYLMTSPDARNPNQVMVVRDAWLDPSVRNKGLGKGLYREAAKAAQERGFRQLTSDENTSVEATRVWQSLKKNFPVEAPSQTQPVYRMNLTSSHPKLQAVPAGWDTWDDFHTWADTEMAKSPHKAFDSQPTHANPDFPPVGVPAGYRIVHQGVDPYAPEGKNTFMTRLVNTKNGVQEGYIAMKPYIPEGGEFYPNLENAAQMAGTWLQSQHRGKGIGASMYNAAIQNAFDRGFDVVRSDPQGVSSMAQRTWRGFADQLPVREVAPKVKADGSVNSHPDFFLYKNEIGALPPSARWGGVTPNFPPPGTYPLQQVPPTFTERMGIGFGNDPEFVQALRMNQIAPQSFLDFATKAVNRNWVRAKQPALQPRIDMPPVRPNTDPNTTIPLSQRRDVPTAPISRINWFGDDE